MVTQKKKKEKGMKTRSPRVRSIPVGAKSARTSNSKVVTPKTEGRNGSRTVFFCSSNAAGKSQNSNCKDKPKALSASSSDTLVQPPLQRRQPNVTRNKPFTRPPPAPVHIAGAKATAIADHIVKHRHFRGPRGSRSRSTLVRNAAFVPEVPHLTTAAVMALRQREDTPLSTGGDFYYKHSSSISNRNLAAFGNRSCNNCNGNEVAHNSGSGEEDDDDCGTMDMLEDINPAHRASDFEPAISIAPLAVITCPTTVAPVADPTTAMPPAPAPVPVPALAPLLELAPALASVRTDSIAVRQKLLEKLDPAAAALCKSISGGTSPRVGTFATWDGRTLFEDDKDLTPLPLPPQSPIATMVEDGTISGNNENMNSSTKNSKCLEKR